MSIDAAKRNRRSGKNVSATALATGTALQTTIPASDRVVTPTDNQPQSDRLPMDVLSKFGKRAFQEIDAAEKSERTAIQCMAYAIMGLHDYWVAASVGTSDKVGMLSAAVPPGAVRIDLVARARKHYTEAGQLVAPPTEKEATAPNGIGMEKYVMLKSVYDRHNMLIGRGVEMAAMLAEKGLTTASFNGDTCMWSVPYYSLCDKDARECISAARSNVRVPLDGKSYGVVDDRVADKTHIVRFTATVKSFTDANRPPRAGRKVRVAGTATTPATDAAKQTPTDNAPVVGDMWTVLDHLYSLWFAANKNKPEPFVLADMGSDKKAQIRRLNMLAHLGKSMSETALALDPTLISAKAA